MPKTHLPLILGLLLLLFLSAPGQAQAPALTLPLPGREALPAYTPVSQERWGPAELLRRQAAWVRNQVWATGDVADAGTYLFPKSYDITSGYVKVGSAVK